MKKRRKEEGNNFVIHILFSCGNNVCINYVNVTMI